MAGCRPSDAPDSLIAPVCGYPPHMTSPTTGAPHDGTTLTEVLAGYAQAGFHGTFTAGEQATVECNSCGVTNPASAFQMASLRRLEGASDPDDMISVMAVTCPNCKRDGVLILGYGPHATAEDSDIAKALQDFRHDDTVTGNSAPGEAALDAPDRNSDPAAAPGSTMAG